MGAITMQNDPRGVPFDVADYLKTPEEIAEFLAATTEDYDERTFNSALDDAIRAVHRIMPDETSGFSDNPAESSLFRLVALLHALGFDLAIRPKHT
jgi:DNA-binding phage protein